MAYRRPVTKKNNRLSFGDYPLVSLAEARGKCLAARKLLNNDVDPAEQRDQNKQVAIDKAGNTFEKIAREWHNNRLSAWSASTAKDTINRLEKDIFPQIGDLPIASISHQQMIGALRKIEERGAGEIAHRIKATCARVFSYANQNGIENKNPAADLKDVLRPVKSGHFAAISPEELPAFLESVHKNDARLCNE